MVCSSEDSVDRITGSVSDDVISVCVSEVRLTDSTSDDTCVSASFFFSEQPENTPRTMLILRINAWICFFRLIVLIKNTSTWFSDIIKQ